MLRKRNDNFLRLMDFFNRHWFECLILNRLFIIFLFYTFFWTHKVIVLDLFTGHGFSYGIFIEFISVISYAGYSWLFLEILFLFLEFLVTHFHLKLAKAVYLRQLKRLFFTFQGFASYGTGKSWFSDVF